MTSSTGRRLALAAVVVLLACTQCCCFLYNADIDMSPRNPIAVIGERFELNCTIQDSYSGPLDSSSLSFRHNNRNYTQHDDPDIVVAVDSRTAVFVVANVTDNSHGHYACFLPGVQRASESLGVIRRPRMPQIIKCFIYSWERMECHWTPSSTDQKNYTRSPAGFIYRFEWARRVVGGETMTWKNCSTVTGRGDSTTRPSTECSINDADDRAVITELFDYDERICVRVVAVVSVVNGDIEVASSDLFLDVRTIVGLEMPSNVNSTVNDSYVIVHWRPVQPTLQNDSLLYNVTIQSQWPDEKATILLIRDATQCAMKTSPFTRYNISVSVKPDSFGLWSSRAFTNVTSYAAAPTMSPSTSTSSFQVTGVHPNVYITFYWKPLPTKYHFGPNFSYSVLSSHGDDSYWVSYATADTNKSSITRYLTSTELGYKFSIVSGNRLGHSSPTVVWTYDSRLQHVITRLSLEGSGSQVAMYWNVSADYMSTVTGFTVFWCKQLDGKCKANIDWMNLPPDARYAEFSVPGHYKSFVYGLATSSETASGGIKWAECIHNRDAPPSPPKNVEVMLPNYADHGHLLVEWSPVPCSANEGLAFWYNIHYCQLNDDDCSGEISVANVTADHTSWNLIGLNHRATYLVWMTSISSSGLESIVSNNSTANTSASWATAGVITAIVVSLMMFVLLSGCLFWRCCKGCCSYQRWFRRGLPISVPVSRTKDLIPEPDADESAIGYNHPRDLHGNGNLNHLTKPLISKDDPLTPLTATETPSPTVCGCGQGDIRWYVNSRHPASEDGDNPSINYHQTYRILNPSGTPNDVELSTASLLTETTTPRSDREVTPVDQPLLQPMTTSSVYSPPSNMPTASLVGETGYIVVGPNTFGCVVIPDLSIPSAVRLGTADSVDIDRLPASVERRLPDVCAISSTPPRHSVDTDQRQSNDISGGDNVTPAGDLVEDTPGADVPPVSNYAMIVGALGQSGLVGDVDDKPYKLDVAPSPWQPVAVDRSDSPPVAPRHDSNVSFGNGAVIFQNGYVRHNDLFGPTAAMVDS